MAMLLAENPTVGIVDFLRLVFSFQPFEWLYALTFRELARL